MLHVILILLVFYAVCRGYAGLQMYCWRRANSRAYSDVPSPLVVKPRAVARPDAREAQDETIATESMD